MPGASALTGPQCLYRGFSALFDRRWRGLVLTPLLVGERMARAFHEAGPRDAGLGQLVERIAPVVVRGGEIGDAVVGRDHRRQQVDADLQARRQPFLGEGRYRRRRSGAE